MLLIIFGTVPAFILRFIILKKPMKIGIAALISFLILVISIFLMNLMEIDSSSLSGAITASSFFVLITKSNNK